MTNVKGNNTSSSSVSTYDIRESTNIAQQFVKLYYECLDKKRHIMSKLYKDDAALSWNGHGTKGNVDIVKFLSDLPTCDHDVRSMDCHKLPDIAVPNEIAYLISTSGYVKYKNIKKIYFNQNFIIIADGTVWKIVSDTFRLQETPTMQ